MFFFVAVLCLAPLTAALQPSNPWRLANTNRVDIYEQGEIATWGGVLPSGHLFVTGYTTGTNRNRPVAINHDDPNTWDKMFFEINYKGQLASVGYGSGMGGMEWIWTACILDDGTLYTAGTVESHCIGTRNIPFVDREPPRNYKYQQGDIKLWTYNFEDQGEGYAWDVLSLQNSNIVVVAESKNEDGSIDAITYCLSDTGELLWRHTVSGNYIDRLFSIAQLDNGDLVLTGMSGQTKETTDVLIVRLAPDGTEKTVARESLKSQDVGHDIIALKNGGYIIAGYTSSPDNSKIFLPWVRKYDANNNILWDRIYPTNHSERLLSITQARNGQIVGTGFHIDDSAELSNTLFLAFDPESGDLLQREYIGSNGSQGRHITALPSGDIALIGSIQGKIPSDPTDAAITYLEPK
jgi:hypothetical protein